MAVKGKPSTPSRPSKPESIESSRRDHRGNLMTMISLRLPSELAARLEKGLKKQIGRVSRNTYIIQAISEKLDREGIR